MAWRQPLLLKQLLSGYIPYPITVRSFAPAEWFGLGFHGDNRGYSNDPQASARVHQRIDFDTDKTTVASQARSDPTYHRVAPTRQQTEVPEGETSDLTAWKRRETKGFAFNAHYAGSNPLTPGAPAIDVFSSFTIFENKKESSLRVVGVLTGDNFPSTEAFITDPSGQSVFLGIGFYEGSPYTSLWGENQRPITTFDLLLSTDTTGNFTGVTANGRLYSINEWNLLFQQTDPHRGGR